MMIVQEPVQAAIWHCLNHNDYSDAIFLSERLYAEVNSEDSLFLLATAYYRNGQIDYAYNILKDQCTTSVQCRYLLGYCAYELQKYAEAENAICISVDCSTNLNFDDLISEFGEHAAFVLLLLAKVALKTERRPRALEAYKRALKLNPFLWSCFQTMCTMGDKPNVNSYFNLGDLDSLSHCHGSTTILPNQSTSTLPPSQYTPSTLPDLTPPPPHILNNNVPIDTQLLSPTTTSLTSQLGNQPQLPTLLLSGVNKLANSGATTVGGGGFVCTTPEQQMMTPLNAGLGALCMSGLGYLGATAGRGKGIAGGGGARFGYRMIDNRGSPVLSFDNPSSLYQLGQSDLYSITSSPPLSSPQSTATLTDANEQKSFTRKVRALGNLIGAGRREVASRDQKEQREQRSVECQQQGQGQVAKGVPLFSQSLLNNQSTTPGQQIVDNRGGNLQAVRRSSRLFSSSYSVKENNKSPNRSNKFATPKSPPRKSKVKVSKCNLNEINSYLDLNAKNGRILRKEKNSNDSVTSVDSGGNNKDRGNNITNTSPMCFVNVLQVQKHSAEGLMQLMRDLGQAYMHLCQYNCSGTIDILHRLPSRHHYTSWVQTVLALAHFETADYESCVRYFSAVRAKEPYRIEYMDVFSTALWHLQREVALSALAQDLVHRQRDNAITWIVHGNCFSLHKEHDTAIKFLQRAVQVNPQHAYAYTLLGHEYITTEELDKAMSCYRNAIRLDPRHYNAWFGIGTIYSKQERFQLAEMNYSTALSINTSSSVIMCHIAIVQHARKQIDAALATLSRAIALDSSNSLCRFQRGSIFFTCGRYYDALQELERLRELVPQESLVYYLIGNIHKKLGNTDLALQHFSWATDLDPKGASSQIKEAFDPAAAGPGFSDMESPASPSADDESNQQQESIPFGGLNEDSDVSL